MTRYRRVEVGTRSDRRFRELSRPPPNGQDLWLYLLCGQRTTIFPGLIVATEAVIADDFGWPLDAELFGSEAARHGPRSLREAWREVEDRGMARADWISGVIVLPKALIDGAGNPRETARPTSPNALRGWAKAWPEIPECGLKDWYLQELGRFVVALDRWTAEERRTELKTVYADAYRDAFETHLARLAEGVGDASAQPEISTLTRSQRVGDASRSVRGMRLEPARDPVPVPETASRTSPIFQVEVSRSAGDPDLGGDPPASPKPPDPVARTPLEHGQGPPAPATVPAPAPRRGYPPRVRPAAATATPVPVGERAVAGVLSDAGTTPDALRGPLAPVADAVTPPRARRGLGDVTPDPEVVARRELGDRLWAQLNAARLAIASERGWADVQPLHPMDPGRTELAERLRESGASGEASARHVLAVAAAEARAKGTVRWLTGSVFDAARWRNGLGMRVADAAVAPGDRAYAGAQARAGTGAGARAHGGAPGREAGGHRQDGVGPGSSPPSEPVPYVDLTPEDREAFGELARKLARDPTAGIADRDLKPGDMTPEQRLALRAAVTEQEPTDGG